MTLTNLKIQAAVPVQVPAAVKYLLHLKIAIMAKKKSGGSVAGLQKQKAALRAKLSAQKKKASDAKRAAKLKREVESLKNKLKTTSRRKRK